MWSTDIKKKKNGLCIFVFHKDDLTLTCDMNNDGKVSFIRHDKYRNYNKYKVVFTGENLLSRINDKKTTHTWFVRQRFHQKKNDNTMEIALVCDNYESYWI